MKKRFFKVAGLAMIIAMGLASIASAEDSGKFGVRFRGLYVKPSETVDGRLAPVDLKVSDDVTPDLDLEYFFTKNVSTELMAAVTRNDLKAGGQYIGTTWLLPPTLTLKYHPLGGSSVSPYVGAGVNATFPFNSHLNSNVNPSNDFSVDNSVGWVGQAGVDFKLKDNVYFNIDYKYINVNTKITLEGNKYKLNLNPSLIGIGIGYRF